MNSKRARRSGCIAGPTFECVRKCADFAADVVSVKGETRSERWISTENLWKWIDAHGKQFGIGRPYLDRDPPHIGPIDGKEYADKRGLNAKRAALERK